MRNTGPARFFVPVGIILIVFGIIMLCFNTDQYLETSGTITSVTECPTEPDEGQQYDLTVKYTVDGTEYETTFSNMGGNYSTGERIKVYYDPDDPKATTNSKLNGLIAPIMIAAGGLALVFGIYKTASAFKKSRELYSSVPGGGHFPAEAFENFKNASGVTEYYFRFDGHSLKPGYLIEDAERNVLFEGKMKKQAIVGARTYEFRNHVTGESNLYEISHPVTQTYNDEFFSAKSWFKIDGKNVWDLLHDRGIRISTDLHSKIPYMIYEITLNGSPFARVETSSVYVHEDDEAKHKIKVPAGSMYYRIWTASDDLDTLFTTVFAISESEQAVVE